MFQKQDIRKRFSVSISKNLDLAIATSPAFDFPGFSIKDCIVNVI